MPHVASEPQAHAYKPSLPNPARLAPDRAPVTPFDSLLDEGPQGPPDRAAPPAVADNAARPERPERPERPDRPPTPAKTSDSKKAKRGDTDKPDKAKSADTKSADTKPAEAKSADGNSADSKAADSKPADAKTADAKPADAKTADGKPSDAKPSDAKLGNVKAADPKLAGIKLADTDTADVKTDKKDKPDGDSTDLADGKPAADAKIADLTTGADIAKPVSDGKPAIAPILTDAAAAPVPATLAAIAGPGVAAVAPAPVADAQTASQTPTIAPKITPAIAAAGPVTAAAPTAKPLARAVAQADTGKTEDQSKPAAKTELQPHTDDKPQLATVEPDKDANAHARGEVPAKDNRATLAHVPAAPAGENSNAAAPKPGTDALQPAILSTPSHNTAPAPSAANPTATPQLAPQAAPIPLAGVALAITNRALAGKNHFEIRLDPPELGRIEVRLDVDRDGNVTSRMIADRADTLDLLRRDAGGLERALNDAGLKTAGDSLQFSLRDHSTGREQTHGGADMARLVAEDELLAAIEPAPIDYGRLAGHGGGLDIRV